MALWEVTLGGPLLATNLCVASVCRSAISVSSAEQMHYKLILTVLAGTEQEQYLAGKRSQERVTSKTPVSAGGAAANKRSLLASLE